MTGSVKILSCSQTLWKKDKYCKTYLFIHIAFSSSITFQEVCYQYWPADGMKCFGEYQVTLVGEEIFSGFSINTLSVAPKDVSNSPCDYVIV